MKKGKYIAILIAAIIVIVGIVAVIGLTSNNVSNILENEYAQREMLANIYTDMIRSRDINLTLDESALKNIVTGESFSNDTINYLKMVEKHDSTHPFPYVLAISYHKETSTLTVTITSDTSVETQKYKISVENGKLKYEADGFGTIVT